MDADLADGTRGILHGMKFEDELAIPCDLNAFFYEGYPVIKAKRFSKRGGYRQDIVSIWKGIVLKGDDVVEIGNAGHCDLFSPDPFADKVICIPLGSDAK